MTSETDFATENYIKNAKLTTSPAEKENTMNSKIAEDTKEMIETKNLDINKEDATKMNKDYKNVLRVRRHAEEVINNNQRQEISIDIMKDNLLNYRPKEKYEI